MNRRDFLTRVLGSAAALAILPKLDLMAAACGPAKADLTTGPVWQEIYQEVLKRAGAVYRELASLDRDDLSRWFDVDHGMMGQVTTPGGILLAHQYGVDLDWSRAAQDKDRLIEPAMLALYQRAAYEGIDVYGQLDLPKGVGFEFAGQTPPIRMLVAYSIGPGYWHPGSAAHSAYDQATLLRFDVVGGVSRAGRQRATKRHILARRDRERGLPRLDPKRLPA